MVTYFHRPAQLHFNTTLFQGVTMLRTQGVTGRASTLLLAVVMGGFLSVSTPAKAQDLGLNVWGMEFATFSDDPIEHMAFYPGMSLSLTYETGGWLLSPSLGAEWAADDEFWGLMAMLYADRPLNRHLGVDIIIAAMHDQLGDDWANAEAFLGVGGGVSWFIHKRVTLTPNVLLYYGVRSNTWALGPGVNLWVSLEK